MAKVIEDYDRLKIVERRISYLVGSRACPTNHLAHRATDAYTTFI